jgi:hypothetical protein
MSVADDIPLTVDPICTRCDHFGVDWQVCVGQADPVEVKLHISLSDEMPRLLIRFEVALHVATSGEDRFPEFLKAIEMAQNRITNIGSSRREIRFVQSAMEKRSGRNYHFLGSRFYVAKQEEQGQSQIH